MESQSAHPRGACIDLSLRFPPRFYVPQRSYHQLLKRNVSRAIGSCLSCAAHRQNLVRARLERSAKKRPLDIAGRTGLGVSWCGKTDADTREFVVKTGRNTPDLSSRPT